MEDKKIPVIFIIECELKMRVWTRVTEGLEDDVYHLRLGQFIDSAVSRIQQECKERDIRPCIHIRPGTMTPEELEKLQDSTAQGEMERLINDVQRNENRI